MFHQRLLRRSSIIAVASLLAVFMLRADAAGDPKPKAPDKAQTVCPVMGGKISKDVHTDFQGQRVYFCCAGCIGAFKKAPERYLKKTAKAGVVLESVQKTCPVMGRQIKKSLYVDHKGRRVYFCCPGCVSTFKKDPAKYLKKL